MSYYYNNNPYYQIPNQFNFDHQNFGGVNRSVSELLFKLDLITSDLKRRDGEIFDKLTKLEKKIDYLSNKINELEVTINSTNNKINDLEEAFKYYPESEEYNKAKEDFTKLSLIGN